MKLLGFAVLMATVASQAFAGTPAPEIDSSSVAAAVGLVSGGLLVLRSRRAK